MRTGSTRSTTTSPSATNIIGDESPPGLAPHLFAQLHLTHAGEPTNYAEAKGNLAWEATMKQEL